MTYPIESTEAWSAFVKMRKLKGKRAPFTEEAERRILTKLRMFQADGQDAEEILWTSVENGWSGVFEIKRKGWQPPPMTTPGPKGISEVRAKLDRDREEFIKTKAASDAARREVMARIGR